MATFDRLIQTRLFRLAKEPIRSAMRRFGYDFRRIGGAEDTLMRGLLSSECVDLVVDAGANQGQYGNFIRFLGYSGDLVSFEPSTDAYRLLERSAAADPKWKTMRAALGACGGSSVLNVSANSVSSSLLHVSALHTRSEHASRTIATESVPVVTLDEQLRQYAGKRRIWLKLDVQGYEGEVLKGAQETLRQCRVVQSEASVRGLYNGGIDYLGLLQLVRDEGFTLVWIEPGFIDPLTGELLQFDFIAARR